MLIEDIGDEKVISIRNLELKQAKEKDVVKRSECDKIIFFLLKFYSVLLLT